MKSAQPVLQEFTWRKQVDDWRREKDQFFREEATSPFPPGRRARFLQLTYYAADATWRRPAVVERKPDSTPLTLVPGRGIQPSAFVRYAIAHIQFPSEGSEALSLYTTPHQHDGHPEHEPYLLFLPFRDATSGHETYSAGRYLEIPNPLTPGRRKAECMIDFNFAYNPACAYSDGYVCPLPPEENWLHHPVAAGEQAAPIFVENHQGQ